jgi:hypothetical protein
LNRFILVIIVILLSISSAFGQDSHYWSNFYGTRAQLLNGLVVGSKEDLSSTYYNPGVLALTKEQYLVLTTDALQLTRYDFKNAAGNDVDLRNTSLTVVPNIIAFRIPINIASDHNLAISYLTKIDYKYDMATRVDESAIHDPYEQFAGEIAMRQNASEPWFGISWAYNIGNNIGLGITSYYAIRSQSYRLSLNSQSIAEEDNAAALNFYDDFSFYNVRALWKIGVLFDGDPLSFGLTLTTPSVNLFGSGDVAYNLSAINLTDPDSDKKYNEILADNKENVSTKYSNPLSVALGFSYKLDRTVLYFSGEYYAPLPRYSFLDYSTKDIDLDYIFHGRYEQMLGQVFNYGLGLQHEFNDNFSYFGAISLDHSARIPDEYIKISLSSYDVINLTSGVSFTLENIDYTVGLSYSFGSAKSQGFFDFYKSSLVSEGSEMISNYKRIKLVIGVSFLSGTL